MDVAKAKRKLSQKQENSDSGTKRTGITEAKKELRK
jgi:hypothetical protein